MRSSSLDGRERAALADLLEKLGPSAPTCCEGWSTAHLAAHLVVRDRRPDALPGYGLEPVLPSAAAWSHRLEDRLRERCTYASVVDRVRSGPPRWLPMGWPGLGPVLNTAEFVIHHEDARRAQPSWEPRALPPEVQDELWRSVAFFARRAAGAVDGELVLRRADRAGVERRVGSGRPATTVTGDPLELLLWCSGRRAVARVEVNGG